MRPIVFLVVVFLAGLSTVAGQDKDKKPRPLPKAEWLDPDRGAPNGTKYQTFASKVLERDVSFLVYLPPGYEQAKQRYPVIYWLHGWGGSQRSGATLFIPHLEAAIKQGALPPVIAVLVNGMGYGAYCDAPNGQRPIESVIIKDLIPHVDKTWRTLYQRSGRIIQGYSMGGFGAGHLGFKYPELFGTVIVDAGALEDAKWRPPEEHPSQLARKNAAKLRDRTNVRIGVGSQDSLLAANKELHLVLQELKIPHQYEVLPEVGHNAALYYKTLGTKGFLLHRKALEGLDR